MFRRDVERELRTRGYSRRDALVVVSRGARWLWLARLSRRLWLRLTLWSMA